MPLNWLAMPSKHISMTSSSNPVCRQSARSGAKLFPSLRRKRLGHVHPCRSLLLYKGPPGVGRARLRPIRLGPEKILWTLHEGWEPKPRKGAAPKGGAPKGWGPEGVVPEGWEPKTWKRWGPDGALKGGAPKGGSPNLEKVGARWGPEGWGPEGWEPKPGKGGLPKRGAPEGVKGINPAPHIHEHLRCTINGYGTAYTFTHNNITLEHTAMNNTNTTKHTDANNTQF